MPSFLLSRRAWLAGCLAGLLATACQRGPYQATAHLPATTSQPVGSAVEPDASAIAYIQPYHDKVLSQMQVVIGSAPVALSQNDGENPLANFVTDLQRTVASRYFNGEPIALSVMTNGSLRADLPAGPITIGNVFELMPFENELMVLDAPGPVVQQLFDYAATSKMAVSGATYTIGPDGHSQSIRINGQPFDPTHTYSIAASSYLASGGDHMDFFRGVPRRHTGLLLRSAITDYIRALTAAGQPVTAKVEGRVRVL